MADTYARLKTTPNGPGPQHKVEGRNEFEFTEGKDGKLNVRDVDVKAELELIKQQQQQILQRLDSPIETQLTGSKEEFDLPVTIEKNTEIILSKSGTGITIPSGTRVHIDIVDIKKYSQIFIQFRPGSVNNFTDYDLDMIWHAGDSSTPAFEKRVMRVENSTGNVETEWVETKGVLATIAIRNRTDDDKTFVDLTLFGRRL